MSKVFLLDTNKVPLNPVHQAYAHKLLTGGKATIFRWYPFTIILKKAVDHPNNEPLRLKIGPGSKVTGLAIVNDKTGEVIFAADLTHRGKQLTDALESRRMIRRGRRQRKTRYRQARWKYRKNKKEGWLPPSLQSRITNTMTWVERLSKLCPIDSISLELVKFDMQKMENPEISGIEYTQGTLLGYEIREYLLEKWKRQCAYCGAKDVPLYVEHINPRSRSRDNRVSNLTLSCKPCDLKKGNQDIREFLLDRPELLTKLLAQAKVPLKDAAAVNSTRWALYTRLKEIGLPIECGSGGLTKFNRSKRDLPKTAWLDAACVGTSTPEKLLVEDVRPLLIAAKGHGHRQVCATDSFGFPRRVGKDERPEYTTPRVSGKERHPLNPHLMRQKVAGKAKWDTDGKLISGTLSPRSRRRIGPDKRPTITPRQHKRVHGFQTGDMVKATIPKGEHAGVHVGRMVMQSSGTFYFGSGKDRLQFSWKYVTPLQRADGYSYTLLPSVTQKPQT